MPSAAVHPGQMLHDQLQAIGVKPSELARQIDVPANRISQIINGKRAITGDTALRLAHWFKTAPDYWLGLQTSFDLQLAERAAGAAIRRLPSRPDQQSSSRSNGHAAPRRAQGQRG